MQELFDEAASETADIAVTLKEEFAKTCSNVSKLRLSNVTRWQQELAQLPVSQQASDDAADDPAPAATLTESQKE